MFYNDGMTKQEKVLEIIKRFQKAMPHPKVELNYKTPWELLVATILAAQATDKKVNELTPALFAKYPTVFDFAKTTPEDVDKLVNHVLFHKNKSKSIVASAKVIVEKYHGQVPKTMEEVDGLPGVARKTANVVLGTGYGIPYGIVIDTHGIRMSNKLGLVATKDPVKIEEELMKLVPKKNWIDFGHWLTLHGRHQCPARPHDCTGCDLGDLCPEYPRKH